MTPGRLMRGGLAWVLALAGLGLGAGWTVPVVAAPPAAVSALPPTYSDVPPGCNSNEITMSNGPNQAIPDATSPTSPGIITATLSPSHFTSLIYTMHVSVTVNISHTNSADLQIFLISPHGTRVSLAVNRGFSLDNVFEPATFDDRAGLAHPPGPVTLATFHNNVGLGFVNPEEPLSAFNGENPNGTWKLEVRDSVHTNTGTLNSWALSITAVDSVPTPNVSAPFGFHAPEPIPDDSGQLDVPLFAPTLLSPIYGLTLTTVITHAAPGQLDIELITPDGITLTVSNGNGGSNSNVFAGTTWFDGAGAVNPPGAVTENKYTSGQVASPLAPQEAFAETNGFDATNNSGFWHLLVRDAVPGVAGTLGDVKLGGIGLSCLPELEPGNVSLPAFPRLGRSLAVFSFMINRSAPASDVLFKTSVGGGLAYQAAAAPGWSCAPPAAGMLNPVLDCLRTNMTLNEEDGLNMTLTAPLRPEEFTFTSTATSSKPNLQPSRNTSSDRAFVFADSANGNPWDVLDSANLNYDPDVADTGGLKEGGQGAFGFFGQLDVRVLNLSGTVLADQLPGGFGLVYSPGHRWHSLTPQLVGNVRVQRDLFAPSGANWLRYLDHFQNTNGFPVKMVVGWGGTLGSTDATKVAATSSGDVFLNRLDRWGVTFEQDTPNGPSTVPPVATVFRSAADSSYLGPYVFTTQPITTTFWPSLGNGDLGHVFSFELLPGQTRSLAYFMARGLAEGQPGPVDCDFYGGCVTPAAGSQVAQIESAAASLAAVPYFCDLSGAELAEIVNWPGISVHCRFLPTIFR